MTTRNMNEFYVNVVVHGDVLVEAESEEEAIEKAEDIKGHDLENTYHVDVHCNSVEHLDGCTCPLCDEEEDE